MRSIGRDCRRRSGGGMASAGHAPSRPDARRVGAWGGRAAARSSGQLKRVSMKAARFAMSSSLRSAESDIMMAEFGPTISRAR